MLEFAVQSTEISKGLDIQSNKNSNINQIIPTINVLLLSAIALSYIQFMLFLQSNEPRQRKRLIFTSLSKE